MLVCVLSAPLLIQFPANVLEKAVEDGTSVWAPTSHTGDPDEAPDSVLQPGPDLTSGHLRTEPADGMFLHWSLKL